MAILRDHKRGPKVQPAEYRGEVTTIRLTPGERAIADRLARREGTTRTDIIRTALSDYHLRSDC